MSDQVAEQSPQSRLEAMLGDSVESDVKPPELQDEEEQAPLEADAEDTEEVESEEATEDPDDQAEEEEQSEDEVPALLKLKVNGEDVEKEYTSVFLKSVRKRGLNERDLQIFDRIKEQRAVPDAT